MFSIAKRLSDPTFQTDLPVTMDIPASIALLENLLDERFHRDATFSLACLLMSGEHADLPRAVRLFERCVAETLHEPSMLHLADIFLHGGESVPSDPPRAVRLLKTCVDATFGRHAVFQLVRILARGAPGVPRDSDQAFDLCDRYLDEILYYDYQVQQVAHELSDDVVSEGEQNLDLAIKLYELCISRMDDHDAMVELASILIVSGRDPDRAVQLCKQCVEACPNCFAVRGLAKSLGESGCERCVMFAKTLYEMCVEGGNGAAMVALAEMVGRKGGGGDEADFERGRELCRRFLEGGGDCFKVRKVAERKLIDGEIEFAVKLLGLCAGFGDARARRLLVGMDAEVGAEGSEISEEEPLN